MGHYIADFNCYEEQSKKHIKYKFHNRLHVELYVDIILYGLQKEYLISLHDEHGETDIYNNI